MNRILNCVASDFGQPNTSLELKDAIKGSGGRTILSEIDGRFQPLFDGITSAEIASAFGADLVMLKRTDWVTCEFGGVRYDNPVEAFRKLAGIGVGVNFNVAGAWGVNYAPIPEALDKFVAMGPDFLSLTGYHIPEVTKEEILKDIKNVRDRFAGFLNVHHVLVNSDELDLDRYLAYVDAGADMITMPVPGTVQGITVERLHKYVDAIHAAGALVSLTTFTSQEGSDVQTVRDMAIAARMAGADVFAFGDANICGVPEPEDIMAASLAMRGKRHTYLRMARSATR